MAPALHGVPRGFRQTFRELLWRPRPPEISRKLYHLKVVEATVALGVVADEAHLQGGLRVFDHGRRYDHGGNGLLSLVVELHPADDTAPSRELLHGMEGSS